MVSLTNLPCWVGWLWVGGLERRGVVCRSGFTVIEPSLCTGPTRFWSTGLSGSATPQLRVVALPRKLLLFGTCDYGCFTGCHSFGTRSSTCLVENRGQVKTYVSGCFWLYDVYFFLLAVVKLLTGPPFSMTFAEVHECHFCVRVIPSDTLLASAHSGLVEFHSSDIDLVGRLM